MPAIGVLTLEIHIEEAHSLKEKRHLVKGLKDRLRHRFNIAVAEIGFQDSWQQALVAAATVSGDHRRAAQVLVQVERDAARFLGGALVGSVVEWLE